MNWKNKLSKKAVPSKDDVYRKVYMANVLDIAEKQPTDQAARMRAMFDLWCDTVADVEKNDPKSLEHFEKYLENQSLV